LLCNAGGLSHVWLTGGKQETIMNLLHKAGEPKHSFDSRGLKIGLAIPKYGMYSPSKVFEERGGHDRANGKRGL
jgi:hypothetical protein